MHLFTKVLSIVDDIGLHRVADTHQQDIGGITAITFVFRHPHTQDYIVIVVVLHRRLHGLKGIVHSIGLRHRR